MKDQVTGETGQGTGTGNAAGSMVRSPSSLAIANGGPTTGRARTKRFSAPHSSPVIGHWPSVTRHSIEVHIEELVLDGFDPRDRHRIADAVERELARLFAEQGVLGTLAEPAAIDRLDVGAFRVKPPSRPEKVGAQVAQAVYSSLLSSLLPEDKPL